MILVQLDTIFIQLMTKSESVSCCLMQRHIIIECKLIKGLYKISLECIGWMRTLLQTTVSHQHGGWDDGKLQLPFQFGGKRAKRPSRKVFSKQFIYQHLISRRHYDSEKKTFHLNYHFNHKFCPSEYQYVSISHFSKLQRENFPFSLAEKESNSTIHVKVSLRKFSIYNTIFTL